MNCYFKSFIIRYLINTVFIYISMEEKIEFVNNNKKNF